MISRRRNYHRAPEEKNHENRNSIEAGGGVNVNQPRPRLSSHLHYVGSHERTRRLREPARTKNLVRLPLGSCSAPGDEGA